MKRFLLFVLSIACGSFVWSCAERHRVELTAPVSISQCSREVLAKRSAEYATRSLSMDTWFSLLLSNYDPHTKRSMGRPRDCQGTPIAILPYAQGRRCDQGPFLENLAARPSDRLDGARLVRQSLSEHEELVWLQTHVDENEDALGPLARVRWTENGIEVQPLGTLAAHRHGVQMRILGRSEELLAVESDRCSGVKEQRACDRELRVRTRLREQYVDLPMIDEKGRCSGEFKLRLADGFQATGAKGSLNIEVHRMLRDGADGPEILEAWQSGPASASSTPEQRQYDRQATHLRRIVRQPDAVLVGPGVFENRIELDRREAKMLGLRKGTRAR